MLQSKKILVCQQLHERWNFLAELTWGFLSLNYHFKPPLYDRNTVDMA